MNKSHYSISQYNGNQGLRTIPKLDKDGELYFNVYAYKKVKDKYINETLIMKISENDDKCMANWYYIYFTYLGGYRFDLPQKGDKPSPINKVKRENLPGIHGIGISKEELLEVDDRFKYLVNSINENHLITMDLIINYRKYPFDVEMLCRSGLTHLASGKKIFNLSKAKKKALFKYINVNVKDTNYTINDWIDGAKYDIPIDYVKFGRKVKSYGLEPHKAVKYISEVGNQQLYLDYLEMINGAKDLSDPYWAYPKNLIERHDKVLSEINNLKYAKLKQEYKEIKCVCDQLRKEYPSLKVGEYEIDFPKDIDDIIFQASKLKQCLISSNYHKRMMKKQLALIFIKKDNEPVATVEVNKDLSIGQFYGNERDRNNCLPSIDVKEAFDFYKAQRLKGRSLQI